MKYITYCIIICFIFCSACEQIKDTEYELPFEGEVLTMYGFISEDFSIAQVYKTQPVLTSTDVREFNVEPVKINLLQNNSLLDTFTFIENGHYEYDYALTQNNNYRIETSWNDLTVSSENIYIPSTMEMDSFRYTIDTDNNNISIEFSFQDIEGDNYYDYTVEKYSEGERILSDGEDSLYFFNGVFADEDFKSERKQFLLNENTQIVQFDEDFNVTIIDCDSIVVTLYTLSEEIFLFYESNKNNDGDLGAAAANAEPLWSNIEGGYGVVCGFAKYVVPIQL